MRFLFSVSVGNLDDKLKHVGHATLDFSNHAEGQHGFDVLDDNARTREIIRWDIKPDNVMVRPEGLIKLLDFGIAKVSPRSRLWAPTAEGQRPHSKEVHHRDS